MATKLHGTDYIPPDLVAKFTGKARYAEDFRADGMLFTKLLLSPMPHARVTNVDASEALAMEGVVAILRAEEVPGFDNPLRESCLTDHPLYEGEPILAVAAVDERTAADAIEKIEIDFEELPFALDPMESLRPGGSNARVDGNVLNTIRVEGERPRQEVGVLKWTEEDFRNTAPDELPIGESQDEWVNGDIEAGFAEADEIIEESIYHQSVTHHPMEPRTCMSYWRNGKLYIHPSTQSNFVTHRAIAGMMQLDPADVVMICEFCGGGFGSKIAGTINMPISALLAKKTGLPVMQRVTRYEETYYGRARPGFQARVKMGFRSDGRLTALDLFIVQDNGPYGRSGDARSAGEVSSLSYQPLNMRHRTVSVFTNTPPRAAQRAPGGAQITAMLEPLISRAAKKLGIDQLEMRRINAPTADSKFGARQGGLTSVRVHEAIDKMKPLVDWDEVKGLSGQRNGSKVTGIGVALSSYTAGAVGFDGMMVLRPNGRLSVHTGVGNLGTHSYSDTARTACEVLDFPWEKVDMVWGDSSKGLPNTSVQAGSMTTMSATRAIYAGAMDLKQKLQEIAAKDLGGSPSDYQVGGERVFRPGGRSMTMARAAERAIALGGRYSGEEVNEDINGMTKAAVARIAGQGAVGAAKDNHGRDGSTYSFVVGYARVEVDVETGDVEMIDYAAVTDCGLVMNPRSLAAQLHGGGVQGFGMARGQKWVYDQQWGVPFAHRFYTARPPGILDVPLEMKADFVDIPDPSSPVGAKGIGEPPVGAGSAAVVCAIQDALGDTLFKRTPIMTDMILNSIDNNPQPFGVLAAHV